MYRAGLYKYISPYRTTYFFTGIHPVPPRCMCGHVYLTCMYMCMHACIYLDTTPRSVFVKKINPSIRKRQNPSRSRKTKKHTKRRKIGTAGRMIVDALHCACMGHAPGRTGLTTVGRDGGVLSCMCNPTMVRFFYRHFSLVLRALRSRRKYGIAQCHVPPAAQGEDEM